MGQSGSLGEKAWFLCRVGTQKSHEPCDLVANSWPGDQLQVVRRFRLRDPPRRGTASKINTVEDNLDYRIHVACLLSSRMVMPRHQNGAF